MRNFARCIDRCTYTGHDEHMNTATTTYAAIAADVIRREQHAADLALLDCPADYLARIGVTAEMIEAADTRVAAFEAAR